MKNLWLIGFISLSVMSQAQLYGVGQSNSSAGGFDFYQVNTSTGAATPIFNFNVNGAVAMVGLTYIPTTNKFVTTAQIDAFNAKLVEIDLGAMTGTVVNNGIPADTSFGTKFFEGLEYMPSLGGLVVSYGVGGYYTGKLALLNPVGYGLTSSNALYPTLLADGDTVFMDGTGALNVLDFSNPASTGFHRNRVNNPFGAASLTGVGANMFGPTGNADLAWKADESRLFISGPGNTALYDVNGASTAMSLVGNFGAPGTVVSLTGLAAKPVPEPASLLALGLGAVALLRRRKS